LAELCLGFEPRDRDLERDLLRLFDLRSAEIVGQISATASAVDRRDLAHPGRHAPGGAES